MIQSKTFGPLESTQSLFELHNSGQSFKGHIVFLWVEMKGRDEPLLKDYNLTTTLDP